MEYRDLTLLGVVGLLDPPRRDVKDALGACREAGIRVVMVTGDQPLTALNIARTVGLIPETEGALDASAAIQGVELESPEALSEAGRQRILDARVFARVSPKQKLDLIALHQERGTVVAMTGDGVNDAPALKKADIGIAMGKRGTQVAREAADLVLRDDRFSTIVSAVEDGRIIFANIRKFVLYLLSCNVSEILVVGLASAVSAPLPILPLHILFLNLVTDVFPALALGLGPGDPAVLKQPPRDPREPILTRAHWRAIGAYGLLITAAVLGAFALSFTWLGLEEEGAVSVAFLTLAFAQLLHVFNMRERGSSVTRNDVTRNVFVWGALALCTALVLAAVYVPSIFAVLRLVDPGREGWALAVAMSLLPLLLGHLLAGVIAPEESGTGGPERVG